MNDKEIKIDTVGQIIAGESYGWFITIKEDFENSGGYLILISQDPKMSKNAEGYDYWVEDKSSLTKFFKDFKWQVLWLTSK